MDYYSLPNGFNASLFSSESPGVYPGVKEGAIKTATGSKSKLLRSMAGLKDFGNSSFLDFTAFKISPGMNTSEGVAEQCSVHWCMKTMSAGMEANHPREEILSTDIDSSSFYETHGSNTTLMLQMPNQNIPKFAIIGNSGTWNNFRAWLANKLVMNNFGTPVCTEQNGGPTEYTDYNADPGTGDFINLLTSSTPLETFFQNLATGFTTYVREAGEQSQAAMPTFYDPSYGVELPKEILTGTGLGHANGTSWQIQTQIVVHWGWITLPAVLTIATTGLLVFTITTTKNSKVDVWKLSNIPLFCFQLDRDIQDELRRAQDLPKMEDISTKVLVKLVKSENQDWQLTKQ